MACEFAGPDTALFVATGIFLLVYAGIVTEKFHRMTAGLLGATAMLAAGLGCGFMTFDEAATRAIDWNTIGLLFGMMVIIGVMKPSGAFEYVAVRAARASKGDPWRLMVYLAAVTAFVSAWLDNVTTVLLIIPVTLAITRPLALNPVPYILAEVFASNLGGTATLIGDPPNILIGSYTLAHASTQIHPITFNDFLAHMGPLIALVFVPGILLLHVLFRKELSVSRENLGALLARDPREEIKDWRLLRISMAVLVATVALFFAHGALGVQPAVIALGGAAALLALTRTPPDKALEAVEWPTLLFFVGLFVVVYGIDRAGLIDRLAQGAIALSGGSLLLAMLIVIWVGAVASAFVDNIPLTLAMLPLVADLAADPALASPLAIHPLWWALSLGVCLGGNGTLVGASANLVGTAMSERHGHAISFKAFTRVGFPFMVMTTAAGTFVLLVFTFVIGY